MAITSKARAERVKHNYLNNTVDIEINGKICKVNKFEAEYLTKKMAKSDKFKTKKTK